MSINKELFQYLDYRAYIKDWIEQQPKQGRGQRAALAEKMQSPISHISQVLSGVSNLTPEQAEEANDYFHHDNLECEYFSLLVQLSRAGTAKLKRRIESQIKRIQEKRHNLKDRLDVKEFISTEQQAQFYSQWYYVAVHVILTIEEYQTKESIANYLGLSIQKVSEILDFLITIALVQKKGTHYVVGSSRIHLGSDSPMITKHHTNWRLQAIQSLESEFFDQHLHYSSVMSISKEDISQIKSLLINSIENTSKIVKESKEEDLFSLCIDFFKV